jgi:hypothetical protein
VDIVPVMAEAFRVEEAPRESQTLFSQDACGEGSLQQEVGDSHARRQ